MDAVLGIIFFFVLFGLLAQISFPVLVLTFIILIIIGMSKK